jgi:hypothetical protein
MTKKFSILITIKKDGTPSPVIYDKTNAQEGINAFIKARAQGLEAYWFQSPRADKRCKSEESRQNLMEMTGGIPAIVAEEPETKTVKAQKKASKIAEGITDLE